MVPDPFVVSSVLITGGLMLLPHCIDIYILFLFLFYFCRFSFFYLIYVISVIYIFVAGFIFARMCGIHVICDHYCICRECNGSSHCAGLDEEAFSPANNVPFNLTLFLLSFPAFVLFPALSPRVQAIPNLLI